MKKILLIAAMALFTLTASAQAKFAYVDFNELVMLAPEVMLPDHRCRLLRKRLRKPFRA